MKRSLKNKNQTGLSLVELTVAMAIMVIITGALYTVLISGYDQWNYSDKRIEEYQSARSAMTRMVKELRYSTQVVNTAQYPTGNYSISAYGIPISGKTLTTADNQTYTVNDGPWIETTPVSSVIVRVDGTIVTSGFSINYTTGTVTFASALPGGSTVVAAYTRAAYVRYYLSGTNLVREINGAGPTTVAKHIANQNLTTAIFTWETTNLVRINLIIDRDPAKSPRQYTLESRVRLRV